MEFMWISDERLTKNGETNDELTMKLQFNFSSNKSSNSYVKLKQERTKLLKVKNKNNWENETKTK